MYCPKCGGHNEDADTMCKSCGQPIKRGRELAGFWRRFGAFALDNAVLYLLSIVIFLIFAIIGGIGLAIISVGYSSDVYMNSIVAIVICCTFITKMPVTLFYFAWFESSRYQATPGKIAVGMVVVDLEGKRISFGKAIARTLSKIISAVILGIGFYIIGFTAKRQGLHDMIAGTTVVMKNTVYLDLPEAPK